MRTHFAASPLVLALAAPLPFSSASALAQQSSPLIVVEDHGGVSALPYYEALSPPPKLDQQPRPPVVLPPPGRPYSEADMLPVRSERLSPGDVPRRVIQAPGLTPFFLIGDDDRSRAWLKQHLAELRDRNAIGLIVNVETAEALAALRSQAAGLTLAPVSGDDIAGRLDLRHYPVLITATGIEQ